MRRWLSLVVVAGVCLGGAACGIRIIAHDQQAAATAAGRFAQAALISRDFPAAYALLAPQARQGIAADAFAATIAKMHPQGFPAEVSAVEYEPIPGQAAMNIYLKGRNPAEEFYYRMLMVGDGPSGYQVSYFGRGNGPHPPSNRRPL